MTVEDTIANRRKLLADIASLEDDLSAIERRDGWELVAVERARVSAVRAQVTMQLVALLAQNRTAH